MDTYIAFIDTSILTFLVVTWLIERLEGNCCEHCPPVVHHKEIEITTKHIQEWDQKK